MTAIHEPIVLQQKSFVSFTNGDDMEVRMQEQLRSLPRLR